jgi:hypothetical protein
VKIFRAGQASVVAVGATDSRGGYDVVVPADVPSGTPVRIVVSSNGITLAGLGFAAGSSASYAVLAAGRSSVNEGTTLAMLLNPNIERALASIVPKATLEAEPAPALATLRASYELLATTAQQTVEHLRTGLAGSTTEDAEAFRSMTSFILGAFGEPAEDATGPYEAPRLSSSEHSTVAATLVRGSQALADASREGPDTPVSPLEAIVLETATAVNQQIVSAAQARQAAVDASQLVAIAFGSVAITVPPSELFEPTSAGQPPTPGALILSIPVRNGQLVTGPISPATPRPDFPHLPRR